MALAKSTLAVLPVAALALAAALALGARLVSSWLGLEGGVPGHGVRALGLLCANALVETTLFSLNYWLPQRLVGRVSAAVQGVVSFFILLAAIAWFFSALAELFLMLGFLLAAPFGPIVYAARWGHFDTTSAGLLLTLGTTAGEAACIGLIVLQRRLKPIRPALWVLLGIVLLSFLHGLTPRILVSITDAIGALVVLLFAGLWSLRNLVKGLAVLKAVWSLQR